MGGGIFIFLAELTAQKNDIAFFLSKNTQKEMPQHENRQPRLVLLSMIKKRLRGGRGGRRLSAKLQLKVTVLNQAEIFCGNFKSNYCFHKFTKMYKSKDQRCVKNWHIDMRSTWRTRNEFEKNFLKQPLKAPEI